MTGSFDRVNAAYVRGYYRSNGTYVQPYYRSRANAYTYDNYNYRSPSYSNDTAIINLITVVGHILQIGIPLLTTITTTKSKPCLLGSIAFGLIPQYNPPIRI